MGESAGSKSPRKKPFIGEWTGETPWHSSRGEQDRLKAGKSKRCTILQLRTKREFWVIDVRRDKGPKQKGRELKKSGTTTKIVRGRKNLTVSGVGSQPAWQ